MSGDLPGAGLSREEPGQPARSWWPHRHRSVTIIHRSPDDCTPKYKFHRKCSDASPSVAASSRPGADRPSSPPGTRSAGQQPGQPEGSPAPALLPGYRLPGRPLLRGDAALKSYRGRSRSVGKGGTSRRRAGSAPGFPAERRMLGRASRT